MYNNNKYNNYISYQPTHTEENNMYEIIQQWRISYQPTHTDRLDQLVYTHTHWGK